MTFEDMPNNTKWLKGALITCRHQQRYIAGRFLFYLFYAMLSLLTLRVSILCCGLLGHRTPGAQNIGLA